jgi:hypothetical protein
LEVADPGEAIPAKPRNALESLDLWLTPVEFSTPVEFDLGYGEENKML